MIQSTTSLKELVRQSGRCVPAEPDASRLTAELRKKITFQVPLTWRKVEELVAQEIVDLFDITVVDVFFGGWKKLRELQNLRNEKDYSSSKVYKVPIAKHQISHATEVKLKLRITNQVVSEAAVKLKFSLEIEGALLHVLAGRIKKVEAATCLVKGCVQFEGTDIFKVETSPLVIGEAWDLGEGLLIPE